ncbi:hypothetical protein DL89DRAFT_279237 [Linderina pennispora]|uniref:Uncharacterized protein n=1 Tax=Linderina pennispora TaxID=61395 RepID=A0A1Y1VY60_9FUNG|nr:uncharacterized protein DL89DRAFT_279237 [Linderina pennispora]ORX66211.1 hypothetical protein DL89DRAFT_279237 [Linderina pennispora]
MRWKVLLPLLAPVLLVCQATDVVLDWNIGYIDFSFGRLFSRKAIGVNGKWPLPAVEVTLGDTLIIHAHNSLDEPTSLHSHGLFQNGTNYYDGAAMVTECSIPPNGTFTYRIPMVQAGTYWIHSHYKAQTSDGLRTALIVRDPNDYYKYDEDVILPMSDWFREPGKHYHQAVIKFVKNKTYRLRLLNIGASFEFHFSIDDHELRIIEVDGVPVKEKPTKGVMLAAGQRVSVLVRSKETADNNYLFHADMFTDLFTMPKYNPLNFTGVLEYAPKASLKREVNGGWKITSDLDLEPLDEEALMDPTVQVTLDAYSGVFDDQSFRHSFNNVTFILPEVPTLLTALSTGDNANKREVYGRQSNTYVLNMGDVVEITLNNHDYYTHPFHLHGHVFQIVEIGALRSGLHRTKLARDAPVKRDTFILRGGHYAVLRFRANNPGAWLFHCHIEYHAIRGLELTFVTAPGLLQNNTHLPEGLKENCIAQGIKASGNAIGRDGMDLEGQPGGPNPLPDKMLSYILQMGDEDGPPPATLDASHSEAAGSTTSTSEGKSPTRTDSTTLDKARETTADDIDSEADSDDDDDNDH